MTHHWQDPVFSSSAPAIPAAVRWPSEFCAPLPEIFWMLSAPDRIRRAACIRWQFGRWRKRGTTSARTGQSTLRNSARTWRLSSRFAARQSRPVACFPQTLNGTIFLSMTRLMPEDRRRNKWWFSAGCATRSAPSSGLTRTDAGMRPGRAERRGIPGAKRRLSCPGRTA